VNTQTINDFVKEVNTKYKLLNEQLFFKQKDIVNSKQLYNDLVEARLILSEASRATQMQFKEFVESLVTLAIQTVFVDEGYKFLVEFDLKSNHSIINLLVQQGDKEAYVPEDEQGGGLLEILSFALRIVLFELEKPRSRNIFVMDEPFHFCGALTPLAAKMMKEISSKLNIQIIMVSHDSRLIDYSDKVWEVTRNKGGESIIKLLTDEKEIVKNKIRRRNKV
jgi:DNA repair exonuclease SbcCD ATPase subunit